MICNLLNHRGSLSVSFQIDEIVHELKQIQCIDTRGNFFRKRCGFSPESANSLSNLVIIPFNNRCRYRVNFRIPHDFSSNHIDQSIVLFFLNYLTIVNAWFTVQVHQSISILWIAIGYDEDLFRWTWQSKSLKYQI